jgi:hypothetical protein
MKRVGEADPPSREVGDKVEPLTEAIVVIAEPLSNHNDVSPDHAKVDSFLLESNIPANSLEAQLETSIVDIGVPAKADVGIKTKSEVESPSINIGDANEPQTESIVEEALPPRNVLKSKGKKGKSKVKDKMKAVAPLQSQRFLCSATAKDHKDSTPVIDVDSSTEAAPAKDVSATLFTCDADLPKLELLLSAPMTYCIVKQWWCVFRPLSCHVLHTFITDGVIIFHTYLILTSNWTL